MTEVAALPAPPALYRFSVYDYHKMGEAGILGEDDRVELIDGKILTMSPFGAPHVTTINGLNRLLVRAVGDDAVVSVQNPVRLDDYTEPQPDLALLHPAEGPGVLPHALGTFLIIEVADTTLAFDRRVKLPRYAAAGVPETWIVALGEGYVEVHRAPSPDGYGTHVRLYPGEELTVEALPQAGAFPVADVLGAA